MHITRRGDHCDVRVRYEAKWQWARYLCDTPNGVYVEASANPIGASPMKRRITIKNPDHIEWAYPVTRCEGTPGVGFKR